jgi:hypothetical protein
MGVMVQRMKAESSTTTRERWMPDFWVLAEGSRS